MMHMMSDPVAAMMLLIGLVVVLAVGLVVVRVWGARQRVTEDAHPVAPRRVAAAAIERTEPERPALGD